MISTPMRMGLQAIPRPLPPRMSCRVAGLYKAASRTGAPTGWPLTPWKSNPTGLPTRLMLGKPFGSCLASLKA